MEDVCESDTNVSPESSSIAKELLASMHDTSGECRRSLRPEYDNVTFFDLCTQEVYPVLLSSSRDSDSATSTSAKPGYALSLRSH